MSRISVVFTLFLSVFIISNLSAVEYTVDSPEISYAFEKAGDNAGQLQKVIDHYKKLDDKQKLTAALFLIANMDEHSYATYRLFDTAGVDVNLDVLSFPNYDSLTVSVRAIEEERGEIDYEKTELIYDLQHITSEFLINQIDYAFKAWQEKPWAKNFDFKQFCQYILPYRGSNEPLEEWRKYFYDKYAHITSHMENVNDPLEAAAIINDDIKTWFGFDPRYYYHPTDQGLSEMINSKFGRCEDMTNITIYAMRANGLAVTSDYTPYWANSGNNHAWNAIVTAEGEVIPFMGAEASPGHYSLSGKVGKVYRKTYDEQKNNLIFQENKQEKVPRWLKGKNYADVTSGYSVVADVEVEFSNVSDSIDVAYLCVFNSGQWKPIHWAKIKNISATFNDMGSDVLYLPAFYINDKVLPSAVPFVLQKDSSKVYLDTESNQSDQLKLYATTKRKLIKSTDGAIQSNFENEKVYELFSWSDEWESLGKQTAVEDEPLVFENVPSGGLYWLVAEGSDKEERIFTIDENGKQVWW